MDFFTYFYQNSFSVLLMAVLGWYSWMVMIRKDRSKKVLVVLGSGGHTAEMINIMADWKEEICAVCAYEDELSKRQFSDKFGEEVYGVYRSRRVGQSYVSAIFTTLYSFLPAFWVVVKARPRMIVCNGPGTALPICYAGFFMRFVTLNVIRIVYVESFCRTQSLSLAGKMIYPICDEFYVQWEKLHKKYPNSKYVGLLSF